MKRCAGFTLVETQVVMSDKQSGVAALAVVLLLSIISLMLGLYSANVARTEIKMAVDDNAGNQALDVAKAGLAAAARLIVTHGVPDDELASNGVGVAGSGLAGIGSIQSLDGTSYRFAAFGGGASDGYYVRVTDNHDETSGTDDPLNDVDNTLNVISVGVVGDARRTVQGTLLHLPTKWGIYAYSSLTINGYGDVGAYNSSATNLINVGSGGDMTLGNQSKIAGNLEVPGNLVMSGYATAKDVVVGGNVTMGNQTQVGSINGGGTLYMTGYATATKDVVVSSDVTMGNQAKTGNLNGGGVLSMSGYATTGNTVVVGNVTMGNQAQTGTLDTGGSLSMLGYANTKDVQIGGNITMGNQAAINGDAAVDGTVSTSGYAKVTGTISSPASPVSPTSPDLNFSAPPPKNPSSACGPPYSDGSGITLTSSTTVRGGYNPTSGDLSGAGYDVITMDPGEYCIHNFSLGNQTSLKITGPTVINLTGSWSMTGYSYTNNNDPANLVVNVYGGGAVKVGNQSDAYMVVNAPDSAVDVVGYGDVYGGIIGNTVHIGNQGKFRQDLSLTANGGSVTDLISNWHEVH